MPRFSLTLSTLVLLGTLACNPAEAAPRAFVASDGSDANTATNCGLAKPCRLFAAALTVVDPGGEVIALDAAGYGAVTITKSVTLTANPGYYAGISAAAGNAVTIATPGVNVILRGLNIKGQGALHGIHMTDGSRLSIENCVISNFPTPFDYETGGGTGVRVETAANVQVVDSMIRGSTVGLYLTGGSTSTISGTKVFGNQTGVLAWSPWSALGVVTTAAISDSVLSANGAGIVVAVGLDATARVSVTRSTVANNVEGIMVDAPHGPAEVTISNNLVTGNTGGGIYAPYAGQPSKLKSLGNNTVDQNGTNVIGTITPLSGL